MIHQGDDHSVTARGIMNPPQFRCFWASPIATLLVSCQNNGDPLLEIAGDRFHNPYHLLHRVIVYWVDPPGHSLNKVSIALTKIRGILLFGIEGVVFGSEISPCAVFRNRPS